MSDPESPSPQSSGRSVPGQGVVVTMITFGILATAFLWTYWTVRMTPFMPLQEALEQQFPDSAPRVEGGTIKDSGETVLQVVLRTDFDPRDQAQESQEQVEKRLTETRKLATELADLPSYEILALHLYYPLEEQAISQQTYFRDVQTWNELDAAKIKGQMPESARLTAEPDSESATSDE